MKKLTLYTFAVCLAMVTLLSCKDSFLNEKNYSSYSPETLSDSLGVEASLRGLYYDMSQWYTYSGNQGWLDVWQAGTDIAYPVQPEGIELPYTNYSQLTSTDNGADHAWTRSYNTINDANTVIATLQSSASQNTISEEGRQQAEAEARFFRGYVFERLTTFFGEIPLPTTPTSSAKIDYTRASMDSVNSQIVSDLTYAVEHLPTVENVKSNSNGKVYERVNKSAARQELAVAYLRIGQPDKAYEQTQAIINTGNYELVDQRYGVDTGLPGDYYHDMFIYGNQRRYEGNTEAIWVLEQENPNVVNGGISDSGQMRRVWQQSVHSMPGYILTDSVGGRGLGRMRLNNFVLYDLYQDGDMRNSKYNIKRRYYYNDPSYSKFGQQMQPGDGGSVKQDTLFKIAPETTKWFCFDPNDTFGYAAIKDIPIMRLGGTYLLQAEAQVQMGDQAGAAASINKLRARAFPNYPARGQVTAAQMDMDFILDERIRELVGEENRRETLMRTNTLYDRVMEHIAPSERASLPADEAIPYPIEGLTQDKAMYLPIPQNDIDLNKEADLGQNPGY